jgi:RNA polymerase sigma factor (sigma-70 family)
VEEVRRQYAQIYRFVRRRSPTDQQAEDVTQNVFVDAAAAGPKLQGESPLVLGWLHRVARRRLADEARRRARTVPVVPLDEARQLAAPETLSASAIHRALRKLPPSQRDVIVLKLIEGHTFAVIADRLHTSPAACKMRLVRGLERLRDELEREGITP